MVLAIEWWIVNSNPGIGQQILVRCPRNKRVFRPAAAGLVGCFSRRSEPDRRLILIATKDMLISGTGH